MTATQGQEKQIVRNQSGTQNKFEPGSLQEQDNFLVEMLSSDKIIDIAIFVCFLGVVILGYCCYLVQGHLRFHLGFILILMFGLGISLIIYKCLTAPTLSIQDDNESEKLAKDLKISIPTPKKSKTLTKKQKNEKDQKKQ